MSDERVDLALVWTEFCDLLAQAGEVITRDGRPDDPLDRAEGFRMLTRLLRGALESNLEHADPTHPELVCTCHETIKVVAENPDNLYLGAAIDGGLDYRIWGTRGDARWLSFNTYAGGGFGTGSAGTGTTLHEHQMQFAPDGSFEVIVSQREPGREKVWLPIVADTKSLTIRQTFAHKGIDRPAELHIEVLGDGSAPPAPLREDEVARALLTAAHYVRGVADMGASWADRSARHPNRWVDEETETVAFKDPQITYHQAYFDLGPDEALVVEFTPPRCDYWMIALHNHWMETLDYTHHTITLNNHTAHVETDGSVHCVIAPRDPGVPNWLDTAGHRHGLVGVRWVGDDVADVLPTNRVITLPG